MPRQARLDVPGTLHHIMIRGIEGTRIFWDDQDRQDFVTRIGQLVDRTGTRILAWVLLDNHVHLLIFSGQQGIPKFMRCLLTGYATRFNRRYHRSGHLFQNRYKSIVCEADAYLLELVRYIHLNPLRAGVVQRMEELDRHPWSGHGVLIGRMKQGWQEREYVLRQFSEEKGRAVRAYRKFMEERKGQGRRPELVGGGGIGIPGDWSQVLSLRGKRRNVKQDSRILGGEDFVTGIFREADRNVRRQLRGEDREKRIDRVIKRVCKEGEINEQELRNGGQRRKVSKARARISNQLSHEFGISMTEIARHVGVCTSAVIKAIQSLESRGER